MPITPLSALTILEEAPLLLPLQSQTLQHTQLSSVYRTKSGLCSGLSAGSGLLENTSSSNSKQLCSKGPASFGRKIAGFKVRTT